jgi:hypothetical protein
MKTLMIITPHMSTGGCPQVVAKKVELLKDFYNIIVVEWECVAWAYVVQRNRVINMIGDKFITLTENKEYDLFNLIEDHNPDYIMIEEFVETFIPQHIIKRLYNPSRTYKIFETTHSSHTQPNWKKFLPDKFIFVSPYSLQVFKDMGVPMDLIEYPINSKTSDRTTSLEVSRLLLDYKIKFHFVGNQASNFVNYWKPIMETKPENCVVWGERHDIDTFIQASDIHLFTSKLELNPLSIKESLEYHKPTMIFNLKTYLGKYNDTTDIHFLTGDAMTDAKKILSLLGIEEIQKPKPKIRVVHLLLDPEDSQDLPLDRWKSTIQKQNDSLKFWEKLKDKFYDYVPRYTVVNRSLLPYENCKDPDIINPSKELINQTPVLSYGHYGAYLAHTQGILENFNEDVDALIIAEGDSYSDYSPEEFYNLVLESYNLLEKLDGKMVSYAGPCYMSGGEWWTMNKDYGKWLEVPHFLLGTTYMVMKSERENLFNLIETTGWHSPDFWLAWNYHNRSKLFTSKDPIVKQKIGFSVLDYNDK